MRTYWTQCNDDIMAPPLLLDLWFCSAVHCSNKLAVSCSSSVWHIPYAKTKERKEEKSGTSSGGPVHPCKGRWNQWLQSFPPPSDKTTELEDGGDGSEMKNKANPMARGHAIFSFLLFSLLRHSQLLFFFFFFYARNRLARRQKKKKATRSISFASFKLRIHKQGHTERTGRGERSVSLLLHSAFASWRWSFRVTFFRTLLFFLFVFFFIIYNGISNKIDWLTDSLTDVPTLFFFSFFYYVVSRRPFTIWWQWWPAPPHQQPHHHRRQVSFCNHFWFMTRFGRVSSTKNSFFLLLLLLL